MRLAIIVSELAVGGAERNAINYAIAFQRRGHDVTVIAGDGPLAGQLADAGIRHVAAAAHLRRPWELLVLAARLRLLDHRRPFDIAQCFMASSAAAAGLARALGARFAVVTAPPGVTEDPSEPKWMTSLRLRVLLRASDLVLSTSDPFRQVMAAAGMRPARIVDIAFNAIPLWRYEASEDEVRAVRSELRIADDAPIVCVVARLHPLKRVDLVMAAAPVVLRRVPATRFLIVGDGPERGRLEALASSLGVSAAVHFAGVRHDIGAVLRASTVLVQTTYGFGGPGLSTLEAFAASRPVVAFDAADRRSAIGESGATTFVADADVPALGAAIAELAGDRRRADAMGALGRKWAERHFDLDVVAAGLEPIYRSVIQSRR